ncbi:hypothetical protein CVT26_004813, partial [Gymnopilus dilepis]
MEEHQENAPDNIEPIQDTLTHNLPVEIVAQVFIHFVDAFQPFRWGEDYERRESDFYWAPTLVLSAVCRNWRSIAVVTPELWTSPNIEMYYDGERDTVIEVLGLWLDRSRDLPLHISFIGNDDWVFDYSYWEPVFERAQASSERWESLCLDINRNAWQFFLKEFTCPPCLRRIRLITPEVEEEERQVHDIADFLLSSSSGRLEELRLENLSWYEVSVDWQNLLAVEAVSWNVDDFGWLLGHAPRLKKCRLLDNDSRGRHSPLAHSHLEDLELQDTTLSNIIRWFTFPSLRRLVFKPGRTRWSPRDRLSQMNHLRSFFIRSQCLLVELEIQVPFKTTANLVDILAHLPSLERLTLDFDRNSRDHSVLWPSNESFAEHLKFFTLSKLLPQLKVFKILGELTFSWSALLPFLERPPQGNVTSMLKICVYVQFWLYFSSQQESEDYIDRDVVFQLKDLERKWEG